jgi:hypothetical protein
LNEREIGILAKMVAAQLVEPLADEIARRLSRRQQEAAPPAEAVDDSDADDEVSARARDMIRGMRAMSEFAARLRPIERKLRILDRQPVPTDLTADDQKTLAAIRREAATLSDDFRTGLLKRVDGLQAGRLDGHRIRCAACGGFGHLRSNCLAAVRYISTPARAEQAFRADNQLFARCKGIFYRIARRVRGRTGGLSRPELTPEDPEELERVERQPRDLAPLRRKRFERKVAAFRADQLKLR